MSNRKSILVLLLMIAALVGAHLALRVRGVPALPVGRTLLDASETPVRLSIERRGGQPTVLSRTAEWRLESPYSASADERVVARLLDLLSFTPVLDVIADSDLIKLGRSRSDFSLSEPPLTVRVSDRSGRETVVSFGVPTPSADGVYARVSGLSAVLVMPTDLLSAVEMPADGFRRRSLFRLTPEDVQSLDVKCGKGVLNSFVREGNDWVSGGGRASRREVEKYVSDLLSVEAVDFLWPVGVSNEADRVSESLLAGYGLDPESAVTVSLKSRDGGSERVSFGKETEGGRVYASIQDGGAVVTLPAAVKEAAVRSSVKFMDARLFPQDVHSVLRLLIVDGDVTYALAKSGESAWRLESPIAAAADAGAVERTLGRLLALSTSDVRESDSQGLLVSLSTNVAPVRIPRQKVLGDGRMDDFRSLEVLSVESSLVARLVRTDASSSDGAAQTSSVVYDFARRVWNVEETADNVSVDDKGVSTVLSALSSLKSVRVERIRVPASELDGYGLDRPAFSLAVDQQAENAVRKNILIGGRADGGRYATVGSSDAVFVISEDDVERLSAPLVRR